MSESGTNKQKFVAILDNLWDFSHDIPLFHTGHESPELIFCSGGGGEGMGIREVSLIFFSNRDVLRVSPESDTMTLRIFGGIGSIRLESRKNSLRLAK